MVEATEFPHLSNKYSVMGVSRTVINEAQQRLDRLLAAERDVHDRLQAAMDDIQASVSRVGVSQAAELALMVEDPTADLPWADASGDDSTDEPDANPVGGSISGGSDLSNTLGAERRSA